MKDRLLRFYQMTGRARRRLFAALALLPVIDLLLRLAGFERTYRWLGRLTSDRGADPAGPQARAAAMELAGVIASAGRYAPLNGTCLRQSLLLWAWLRQDGFSPVLRIGVSKAAGFAAHAWVELDRSPLEPRLTADARFVPFNRLITETTAGQATPTL